MAQYIKTEEGYKKLATVTNDKMDKFDPVGMGSFSMNRKVGSVIGVNSHAEGTNTTASGDASHAEGSGTTASNYYSHAEGDNTTASGNSSHAEGTDTTASGVNSHAEGSSITASGYSSHAEGSGTTASGYSSHTEGVGTIASGDYSHAEGAGTIVSGNYSHAQGRYNIKDTSNIYADIIGNGTNYTARSNAATVDWNGNAWFAGDVYTGSTSGTNKDEGSKKLATEEYVNSSIAAGGGSGGASDAVLYTEQSLTAEQQAQARENIDSGVAPYYVAVDRANGTWGTVSKEQLSEMRSARNTGKPVILDMKYSGNNNPRYLPLIYDGGESMGVGDVYFGYDRLGMALAIPNGGGALYKANLFMTESMFKNGDAGEALSIKSKNSDGSIEFGTKRLGAQLPELSSSVDIGLIPCVDGWDSHRFMAWKKPDEIFLGGAGGTDISLGLTSAAVGQIIKVKAIDESGKPTAWEAAEEKTLKWIKVHESTLTENTNIISVGADESGKELQEYNPIGIALVVSTPADATQTNNNGQVWAYPRKDMGDNSIRIISTIAGWKTVNRDSIWIWQGGSTALAYNGNNNGASPAYKVNNYAMNGVYAYIPDTKDHFPVGSTVLVSVLTEM